MIDFKINKNIPLLLTLSITSLATFYFFSYLPSYTRLAIGFLIPFAVFFIFRKEEKFDEQKFLTILLLSIIATILWDSIAMKLNIWGFPKESISFLIFGIPFEEYIFGLWLSTVAIGIYTSLPHFKHHPINKSKLSDIPFLIIIFLLQIIAWLLIFFSNPTSYFKWLLILGIIPSIFYLFRKGEKIDEIRLSITCVAMLIVAVIVDLIFIKAGAWYYNEDALIGRIGIVPIDDLLFMIFSSITIIGIYTSLPPKNILTGKW